MMYQVAAVRGIFQQITLRVKLAAVSYFDVLHGLQCDCHQDRDESYTLHGK